jgi:hypothetical protein
MDGLNYSEGADGASEGGAEVSQEAVERFREQARKAAAQAKQDKKSEQKKKKQDDVLIQIILQFLKNPKYSGFFLLLSRVLEKNVPSDFILALLSLIHKESADALNAKNLVIKKSPTQTSQFPPEIAKPLENWNTIIFSVASGEPHRVLETIVDHEWNIDNNLIQLFSLVLKEFFTFKKFETPFSQIKGFSETFFVNLSSGLEKQIQNQAVLQSGTA